MFDWLEILQAYKSRREPCALVRVTKCQGSTPCTISSRMIVDKTENLFGTVGGGKLEFLAIKEAIRALETNKVREVSYTLGPEFEQCCGGKVELVIEPMNQSAELFLFGAGHIGVEICKLLDGLPFTVDLIDSRDGWFDKVQLNEEVTTVAVDYEDFSSFRKAVRWGKNCYVLIMTHNHTIDFDIVCMALEEEAKFVGLIGSKTKKAKFNSLLKNEMGIKEGMSKITCPIGLTDAGDSPKEIAISIVAQLLEIHYES